LSKNALKLNYDNVEFQNFPGKDPGPPLQGEGKEERKSEGKKRGEEGRRAEGRGGDGEVGRGGIEEGRKEEARGNVFGPRDVPDRSTPLQHRSINGTQWYFNN
jgi:hypothetical protein